VKKVKSNAFDRFYQYAWIIVFFQPLVVYLSSVYLGFVYFDDDVLVLENLQKLTDPANLGAFFTTDVFLGHDVPYYRPLLTVVLSIGAHLGGDNPAMYHFISVLIHSATCLSLFWVLNLLGLSRSKSLAGSLLFSIHPLMANAVFWIPALNDLLITLFTLLSFGWFLVYIRDKKARNLLLHLISFFAALFSKESAIVLPFLFYLYLIMNKQRLFDREKLILAVNWFIIIVIWLILRRNSIGQLQGDEQGIIAIFHNLRFLPEIIARFFLPFNQAIMPVFSIFYTLSGIILILVLGVLLVQQRKKSHWITYFGLAWFLLFAIPNMFIRMFNTADSYDYLLHRAYLPSIGILIMLFSFIPETWLDLSQRKIRLTIAAMMITLAVISLIQQRRYDNGEAFWSSVIKDSPDRAWLHHFYGRYFFKQQNFEKFEEQLQEAIRLKEYGTFYYNLGMIELMQKKNLEKAYSYFVKAIDLGENKPDVMKNFVNLCIESSIAISKTGDYRDATERIKTALKYDPQNTLALMNLALFSINSGENVKAVNLWKKVISLDPGVISAYKNLSYYYSKNTNLGDSSQYYARLYVNHGGNQRDLQGN